VNRGVGLLFWRKLECCAATPVSQHSSRRQDKDMAFRNLILRFAFGGLMAALSFVIARRKLPARLLEWSEEHFDRNLILIYAASRFLVFFVAFFVLHQKPWADLVAVYMPQAHAAMQGLIPYRDFASSYAPLNPYVDALLLGFRDSPLSILVFQIVCDIVSVPFWMKFLRRCMREATMRKAALLYLVQPLVIWEICLDGKNHGFISLLLAIAFCEIGRKEIVSGISFSLTWILVKILPLIFLPSLFMETRKRSKWLVSVVVPSVLVYGAFIAVGADVTSAVRKEGSLATPQNLLYLFGAVTGYNLPGSLSSLLAIVAVVAAVVVTIKFQKRTKDDSARLWTMALSAELILLVVMLMNKKSDTSYLGMCFFLLCAFSAFEADRGGRTMVGLYALLSLLALPIASFWYWPLNRESAPQLHALWLSGDRNAWIMMVMQTLLVASYVGLTLGILRTVRKQVDLSTETIARG